MGVGLCGGGGWVEFVVGFCSFDMCWLGFWGGVYHGWVFAVCCLFGGVWFLSFWLWAGLRLWLLWFKGCCGLSGYWLSLDLWGGFGFSCALDLRGLAVWSTGFCGGVVVF